jgi:phospholipase C
MPGASGRRCAGFDLWVLGPNGFLRHFTGKASTANLAPVVQIRQAARRSQLEITIGNAGQESCQMTLGADAYGMVPARQIAVSAGGSSRTVWSAERSQDWYDFTLTASGISVRAAGRIERGLHGISDPLLPTIA